LQFGNSFSETPAAAPLAHLTDQENARRNERLCRGHSSGHRLEPRIGLFELDGGGVLSWHYSLFHLLVHSLMREPAGSVLFFTRIPLSSVIGGPIGGFILDTFGGSLGLGGLQWLFIIEGVPSVLVGLWALKHLTDKPREAA
jgi:hypothetical protein